MNSSCMQDMFNQSMFLAKGEYPWSLGCDKGAPRDQQQASNRKSTTARRRRWSIRASESLLGQVPRAAQKAVSLHACWPCADMGLYNKTLVCWTTLHAARPLTSRLCVCFMVHGAGLIRPCSLRITAKTCNHHGPSL